MNVGLIKEEFKTVIHCPEEWMAETLIKELKNEFGSAVYEGAAHWWTFYSKETCYWPKINGESYIATEYCRRGWFEENGYRVLDFYDVIYEQQDHGEIEPDHEHLYDLFEIGV